MVLTEIYIFTALALIIAGAAIGFLVVVSSGIRREEREFSLLTNTTDRAARRARRLIGVYTYLPELARKTDGHGAETAAALGESRQAVTAGLR